MERRRLERAAAEKARVEAAAATAELEALAVQEAAARERARAVEVAAVRTLRENLERRAMPWRESRARRTKGVTWTTTPKPIFVSYAPTPDATFVELAYCKKIASILDDVRTIAPPGESKGERVRLAWLDASELGTLVTSTDERALARLEACESCAGRRRDRLRRVPLVGAMRRGEGRGADTARERYRRRGRGRGARRRHRGPAAAAAVG